MDRPTGVKSNMPNGLPAVSARTLATRMLGEVPTSVTMPPSRDAAAMGISRAEGAVLCRRASCSATGMKMASAPTFLVTMESRVTHTTSTGTCVCTVRSRGMTGRISDSTRPERPMAALTTRAAAMITTTSSEKPSNALAAGTMPSRMPASRAVMATRS